MSNTGIYLDAAIATGRGFAALIGTAGDPTVIVPATIIAAAAPFLGLIGLCGIAATYDPKAAEIERQGRELRRSHRRLDPRAREARRSLVLSLAIAATVLTALATIVVGAVTIGA